MTFIKNTVQAKINRKTPTEFIVVTYRDKIAIIPVYDTASVKPFITAAICQSLEIIESIL